MKMKWIVMAGVSVAALAASTVAALGQPGEPPAWVQQRVARRVVERIEGRLNMTAAQREQAKTIVLNERPTIVALAERSRQEREELSDMPSFDESKVREIAAKYAETNMEMLIERTNVRMELRAILTDAQRQQLSAMRAQRGAPVGERLNGFAGLL